MRHREKARLKRRLLIALALAFLAVVAFFLPYLWRLYSDDAPPEGIGRPLAAVPSCLNTLESSLRGKHGWANGLDACIMA